MEELGCVCVEVTADCFFLEYMYFSMILNAQRDCCSGVTVLRAAGNI